MFNAKINEYSMQSPQIIILKSFRNNLKSMHIL